MIKCLNKQIQRYKRNLQAQHFKLSVIFLLLMGTSVGYASYMSIRDVHIDRASYQPLLELIANAESNGNYNAYFAHPENIAVRFTDMTIQEVLHWQEVHIKKGNPSSAVGRYQIINTTLQDLVQVQNLDSQTKFDELLQDSLAITLIERRGSIDYANQRLSEIDFAANLAKEWAALPAMVGDTPNDSFYVGDSLNAARVTPEAVRNSINRITYR